MTDFLVTDAESLSKQSVVFSDGAVKIKSGKTINTFFIDSTSDELQDSAALDDILDISLDDIINESDGEVDFALDDAQSLLQSNGALADGNSKSEYKSVIEKRYKQK